MRSASGTEHMHIACDLQFLNFRTGGIYARNAGLGELQYRHATVTGISKIPLMQLFSCVSRTKAASSLNANASANDHINRQQDQALSALTLYLPSLLRTIYFNSLQIPLSSLAALSPSSV